MYIKHYSDYKLSRMFFSLLRAKCRILILFFILIMILSTTFACNDNSTNASSSTPYFPVQKAGLDGMESLWEGKLELDNNGCMRVGTYLLIWPHGFSLRTEGEEIQVIDSNGQVVAHVGDKIRVGGGEIPGGKAREFIEESIVEQPLPDDCPGPYWIVGETVEIVD